jgi:hypothetical protein
MLYRRCIMSHKKTGLSLSILVALCLISLSVSGMAGAHGAPEADNIPAGVVKAIVTQQPSIAGLSAIILDAPRPGILLRYDGKEPITILGQDDEAFLRFTRTKVEGNTSSRSWRALPNIPQGLVGELGSWVTLSNSGTYGWLDPRLDVLHDAHNESVEPVKWSILIKENDGSVDRISGHLVYKKLR